MEIWPAIDVRGGRCVRLEQGDYARETVFGSDPAEMARHWVAEGADRLHLVDLDGARAGRPINGEAIEAIRRAVDVPCQLGGGIRDEATISRMLALGIDRLVIGSRALDAPGWFREMCRRFEKRLVLGIDARDGRVASGGWLRTSQQDAVELARDFAAEPLAAIVFTDIARDGMLSGPNYAALEAVRRATPLPVIASGGVSSVDHVTGLARAGLAGCIIGRALYEGKITIAQARAASRPPGGVKLVEP